MLGTMVSIIVITAGQIQYCFLNTVNTDNLWYCDHIDQYRFPKRETHDVTSAIILRFLPTFKCYSTLPYGSRRQRGESNCE